MAPEGREEVGLLMDRDREAGGPTGTIREPNSTPIVTSWCGEKRPSQRRMVSWMLLADKGVEEVSCKKGSGDVRREQDEWE